MENRLCSSSYPSWQIFYYSSSTSRPSGIVTYYFEDEVEIYESDKILYSGVYNDGQIESVTMELYEPHELLPVDGKYSFRGGKRYMFHNARTDTSGSYSDLYFSASTLLEATDFTENQIAVPTYNGASSGM